MRYPDITEGKFIDRPNRFVAHVEINGHPETVAAGNCSFREAASS